MAPAAPRPPHPPRRRPTYTLDQILDHQPGALPSPRERARQRGGQRAHLPVVWRVVLAATLGALPLVTVMVIVHILRHIPAP